MDLHTHTTYANTLYRSTTSEPRQCAFVLPKRSSYAEKQLPQTSDQSTIPILEHAADLTCNDELREFEIKNTF